MLKNTLITRNKIKIGNNAETLLNILLGANQKENLKDEKSKIIEIMEKKYKINFITDLSLYNFKKEEKLWKFILKETQFSVGTVPIYLATSENNFINEEALKESIQEQMEEGVSIITIHPTPNRKLLELSKKRLIPFTSRGGGVVLNDLIKSKKEENVYLRILEFIIKKAVENDVIISIGSSFRSASIIDANDLTYNEELKEQLKIADYMSSKGVKIILETPGHVDPNNLNKICKKLGQTPHPIMPLGPMVTDIGELQDDLVGGIGAVLMGTQNCADILSVVTSEEHLGNIPSFTALEEAIKKYEIIKHIIDLAKLNKIDDDYEISFKRKKIKSCRVREKFNCNRCGELCPLLIDILK